MKTQHLCIALGTLMVMLLAGGVAVLQAASSQRCGPMDCGQEPTCTWSDFQWPHQNGCLNTVIDEGDECKYESQGGWTCLDPESDRKCAKQYWNWVGAWGGPEECNHGITGGCGEEDFASQYGMTVPDSCAETYTSP